MVEVHYLNLRLRSACDKRFGHQPMNGPALSTMLTAESVPQLDHQVAATVGV